MTTWESAVADVMSACRDTFGEKVIYTSPEGSQVTVTGILDERSEVVDISQSGVPVVSTETTFEVILTDLVVEPVVDATITTGAGVEYRVSRVTKDRTGGCKMVIHK
ncbi:MAG: hypothetical protein HQL95_01740 [Magnetococcales bacterium]|nr:hypothetical protein [Magnetococcales bacterium]